MVSVITVIITVIVDAILFVERYPALTCSADMLRHTDMACSALRTETSAATAVEQAAVEQTGERKLEIGKM